MNKRKAAVSKSHILFEPSWHEDSITVVFVATCGTRCLFKSFSNPYTVKEVLDVGWKDSRVKGKPKMPPKVGYVEFPDGTRVSGGNSIIKNAVVEYIQKRLKKAN
jgi:hypothetical protein